MPFLKEHSPMQMEIKMNLLGMLIARQKGLPLSKFHELYNSFCGFKALPSSFEGNQQAVLQLMNIHRDILEVRMFYGALYIFVRDPVPENFLELRNTVLNDPANQNKVGGVAFIGPSKNVSTLIPFEQVDGGLALVDLQTLKQEKNGCG